MSYDFVYAEGYLPNIIGWAKAKTYNGHSWQNEDELLPVEEWDESTWYKYTDDDGNTKEWPSNDANKLTPVVGDSCNRPKFSKDQAAMLVKAIKRLKLSDISMSFGGSADFDGGVSASVSVSASDLDEDGTPQTDIPEAFIRSSFFSPRPSGWLGQGPYVNKVEAAQNYNSIQASVGAFLGTAGWHLEGGLFVLPDEPHYIYMDLISLVQVVCAVGSSGSASISGGFSLFKESIFIPSGSDDFDVWPNYRSVFDSFGEASLQILDTSITAKIALHKGITWYDDFSEPTVTKTPPVISLSLKADKYWTFGGLYDEDTGLSA